MAINNILQRMMNDPNTTDEQKKAAFDVFAQTDESVSNYTPSKSGVLDTVLDTSTEEVAAPAAQGGGVLDKLAGLFTDPAFLQAASAFGSSMAGDAQGFQNSMNAYASTMADRRKTQANALQEEARLKREAADKQEQRDWQDQSAYRSALYNRYTPESVQEFLSSQDTTVLKELPLTAAQQATVDSQRASNERADANALEASIQRKIDNQRNEKKDAREEAKFEKAEKKEATESWETYNTNVKALEEATNLVTKIVDDDAFDGFFGTFDNMTPNFLPGAVRLDGAINQLGSKQFLANVTAMKGLGALSNAEGLKIQNAASRLFTYDKEGNPTIRQGLSQEDARKDLEQIRDSYRIMLGEAKKKRDSVPTPDYAKSSTTPASTEAAPAKSTAKTNYGAKYDY